MAQYTVVAVARTPQAAAPPTLVELGPLVGTLTYADILNEVGEASISLSVNTISDDIKTRLRDLLGLPTEVIIYRDSVAVFAGPIVGYSVKDEVLSLDARSLGYYLAYMARTSDYSVTGVDQNNIVIGLINDYQGLAYGNFGIDTTAVVGSGVGRTLVIVEEEPRLLLGVVRELSELDNGFDWYVDPATRELLLPSLKGTDKSASVFLERGVASSEVRATVAAGHIASDVYSVGTGPDIDVPLLDLASNTSVRSAFGRVTVPISVDDISDATNLGDATQAFVDERGSVFFIPGPQLTPVAGAGVADFDTGDNVTYTFDAGLGQITGSYRITKKAVDVSDTGQETIGVEFA